MDWAACVGVDWAEEQHAYEVRLPDGTRSKGVVRSRPEQLHAWIAELGTKFHGQQILVVVEDGRPSLLDALSRYPFVMIIRINPLASKRYRESRRTSGSSSDAVDAGLLCDYALKHLDEVRIWKPTDAATRRIASLCEERRNLVDQRTSLSQELIATLKGYFPQVVEWLKDVKPNVLWQFVRVWPTLEDLRAADRASIVRLMKAHRLRLLDRRIKELELLLNAAIPVTTDQTIIELGALRATALSRIVEVVDQQVEIYEKALDEAWAIHPDHDIFSSLPGAGEIFAPRLAAAFTTDRNRFAEAGEILCFSGIAPVKEESGKWAAVRARYRFPKFIHQTFHEFAANSLPHCEWARECYRQHRERGAGHHAAVRAVAFKWTRIIFTLWKHRTIYDDAVHVTNLKRRGSPLAQRFAA